MRHHKSTMRPSFAATWIRSISKQELHSLIEEVKRGNLDAKAKAIAFVAAESFGIWHNRARAKLCRYFKNHPPTKDACQTLTEAISSRLIDGRFSEQFKDQLAMAIRFDPDQMAETAAIALRSDKEYIRRYAAWTQHVIASSSKVSKNG